MSCWVSQLMHIISVLSYPLYRFSSFLWHRAWLTMAILSCTWSSDLYQFSERKCRLEKSESLVDSQILFAESVDKDITLNKSRSSTKTTGWAVLNKPALLLWLISLIKQMVGTREKECKMGVFLCPRSINGTTQKLRAQHSGSDRI